MRGALLGSVESSSCLLAEYDDDYVHFLVDTLRSRANPFLLLRGLQSVRAPRNTESPHSNPACWAQSSSGTFVKVT